MDELKDRLERDLSGLAQRFGVAGPLVGVEAGLSDPHGHGRTVCRVSFSRGVVYYKPRSLAIDEAGMALAAWLRERGLDLRVPEAWDRGAYGWAAAVTATSVPDRAAAGRFFGRLGAWAALAHALGSSDLHAGNWVVAGEHPVLVDLETLLGPLPVGDRFEEGVLRTLLLGYPAGEQDLAPLASPGILGERWPASDFRAEILAGFRTAYELVQAHGLPLSLFSGVRVRLLLRPTHLYASGELPPMKGPLGELERAALARGDIPHFTVLVDERDAVADGVRVPAALPLSPLETAHARLAALSAEDLREQLVMLTLGLAPSRLALPPVPAGPGRLELAEAIARRLRDSAVPRPDGGVTWVARMHRDGRSFTELGLVGIGLLNGTLGAALFLAAFVRATGEQAWLALARQALPRPRFGQRFDADTAAGLAYGFTLWGELTGEQIPVTPWLAYIAPEREQASDVLGGLGGALKSLLRVPGGLGAALACAERLLALREPLGDGLAWRSSAGTFRAGYAHGQAGIAAQLLALDAVAPDPRWREAAMAGFAMERRWFVPEADDWRLPGEGEACFTAGWCGGAPGQALARLGVAGEEAALEAALRRMQSIGPLGYDFACCGTAGRIEVCLEAAHRLQRPALLDFVREQLDALRLTESYEDRDPRYLKGCTGIGWALLRAEAPQSLPCLLG